jgi:glycine dehydrogenase subunit 1
MQRVGAIEGVSLPFEGSHHVKEFVVNLDATGRTVAEVNAALLDRGIFGGADLSGAFPDLGQALLVCVTEVHSAGDIERLASALEEVLA